MIDSKERRRSLRISSRFPLRYRVIPVAGLGYADARVEDLSPEGLRFQCNGEIRARSGMLLELQLPGEVPVNVFGRVAWVRELPDHGGFVAGGRFEDQSTRGRKTIERFLQLDLVSSDLRHGAGSFVMGQAARKAPNAGRLGTDFSSFPG